MFFRTKTVEAEVAKFGAHDRPWGNLVLLWFWDQKVKGQGRWAKMGWNELRSPHYCRRYVEAPASAQRTNEAANRPVLFQGYFESKVGLSANTQYFDTNQTV